MTAALYVGKQDFRRMVWDQLLDNEVVKAERSSNRNRLPNFMGNEDAAGRVVDMDEFKTCRTIVINRDSAQQPVCLRAIEAGKEVYVPSAHNRYGSYTRLTAPLPLHDGVGGESRRRQVFAEKTATDVHRSVDQLPHIDMFVVGSVAVSKQGYRIGQGDGYSDMDYAVIRTAGHISDTTLVVTTVHDDQVFDRLPSELFGAHDVPIDVIGTPSRLLRVSERLSKPAGVIWSLIAPGRLQSASVIRSLMEKQQADGVEVKLSDECAHMSASSLQRRNMQHADRRGPRGSRYSWRNKQRDDLADQPRAADKPSVAADTQETVVCDGEADGRVTRGGGRRVVSRRHRSTAPATATSSERRAVSTSAVQHEQKQRPARRQRRRTEDQEAATATTSVTSTRSPGRRDGQRLVQLRLLPHGTRQYHVTEAVRRVLGRERHGDDNNDDDDGACCVLSFAGTHCLLRLDSHEQVRQLVDEQEKLLVCGRRVMVHSVTASDCHSADTRKVVLSGVPGVQNRPPPPRWVQVRQVRWTLLELGYDQTVLHWRALRHMHVEFIDRATARRFVDDVARVRRTINWSRVHLALVTDDDAGDNEPDAEQEEKQVTPSSSSSTEGEPVAVADSEKQQEEEGVKQTLISTDNTAVPAPAAVSVVEQTEQTVCEQPTDNSSVQVSVINNNDDDGSDAVIDVLLEQCTVQCSDSGDCGELEPCAAIAVCNSGDQNESNSGVVVPCGGESGEGEGGGVSGVEDSLVKSPPVLTNGPVPDLAGCD